MKPTNQKSILLFNNGGPNVELPIYKSTVGPDVIDIRKLYAQTGMFTAQLISSTGSRLVIF